MRSTAYSCLSCCDAGESGGKMYAQCGECCLTKSGNILHTVHTSCHPTLQHHNRADNYRQWNAFGSPDDGHKDVRNMLRYYWIPINHYLLHLVGFSFTYLSKMHDHSNIKFTWYIRYKNLQSVCTNHISQHSSQYSPTQNRVTLIYRGSKGGLMDILEKCFIQKYSFGNTLILEHTRAQNNTLQLYLYICFIGLPAFNNL